jgi:glycosyltransferase involved in cell wall biosynthesis
LSENAVTTKEKVLSSLDRQPPERPLRVAFCHYAADFHGGSDRGLFDVVAHLPRDRFEPLMLLREGDPLAARYREHGVAVETFALTPPRRALEFAKQVRFFLHFWPSVFRLARTIRRFDADVVHVNTLFNLQGPFAACLARRPLVWHVRELLPDSRVFRLLAWLVGRMSTRIVAMSNAIADELGLAPGRVRVVFGSADLSQFTGLPPRETARATLGLDPGAQALFCPGRFEHWKGQHVLVESLPEVFTAQPGAVALFAGAPAVNKPEYYEGLVKRCEELGIADRVRFLGRRDDVPVIMAASDVLVLPSVTPEPFGLTVVEAMAAGRPVVATAAGGPLDSVADEETGLLARPSDPHDLAAKICTLLADPERARAMGEAGRTRARELFATDREVREMAAVIEEAAGRVPR